MGGEIDRLLSQKDELEERVIELHAELQLARRREGDALAQLHDLRQQLQNTARSFTVLTDYNSDQGGDFSDDYDDEDDGYDEDYSGIQPTSGTEYSTERTTSTSAYGGSSESFTKPKDVPKLMLQGEERDSRRREVS